MFDFDVLGVDLLVCFLFGVDVRPCLDARSLVVLLCLLRLVIAAWGGGLCACGWRVLA